MIGNIIAPMMQYEPPFDPDDVFDPTTHTATEADFIKLLEHGVYDSKYIGYKVLLGNSVTYNGGLWVIADVNHDSTNTGQTNCYDLISQDCFGSQSFGGDNSYRNSNIRSWLNNTFYDGFSNNLKSHMLNIKYYSRDTWYDDDKIINVSFIELNGTTGTTYTNYFVEGVAYPIFTDNNSRAKTGQYWTRTGQTNNNSYVWKVKTGGAIETSNVMNGFSTVPILRVS